MNSIPQIPERERSVEILQQLVRMRTHQPYGNEKDIVKYISSLFPDNSVEKRIIDHGSNRASLVITIPGVDRSRSVALTGHIDTIGVQNFDGWEHPPFAADIDGDLLYGRGAADMKGGLTSIITAALAFVENGHTPPQDVILCFTADEEVTGTGALSLVRGGFLERAEELVVIKPTGEKIGLAEKGAIWIDIEIKGSNGHAAMPESGENAIESFVEFVQDIKGLLAEERKHPLLGRSTCVITTLCGGGASNIIPSSATGKLDIRTLPSVDHETFLGRIYRLINERAGNDRRGLQIFLEVVNNRPPVGMSRRSPLIKRFRGICEDLGFAPEYTHIPYFTDASIFVPALGIPFIFLGPGDSRFYDQTDEYVSISSVMNVSNILVNYMAKRSISSS